MAAAVLEVVDGDVALADVEVRIVPGLSAMQAAAARVGAPLGHDFCVISLSDQLKPWEVVERRLDAAGAADLVLALYNPASRTRREQLDARRRGAARAIAPTRRRSSSRARSARPRSRSRSRRSAALDLDAVDMRTLLIVGSSTTRTIAGEPPRVYTPRRYPA